MEQFIWFWGIPLKLGVLLSFSIYLAFMSRVKQCPGNIDVILMITEVF